MICSTKHNINTKPNPDKPEPRRQRILGQKEILGCTGKFGRSVRFTSSQNVPALAVLNEVTFVGSSPYGVVICNYYTKKFNLHQNLVKIC